MARFLDRQKAKLAKKSDDNLSNATRRRFLLNKYETNSSFKNYFKSELPIVEASGMRWMIDLSKQRKKLSTGSSLNEVQKQMVAKRNQVRGVEMGFVLNVGYTV